jgi:4-alpha-glucanotransferase
MTTDARVALARHVGIVPSYTDQTRRRRRTGRSSMTALLAALGLPVATEVEAAEALAALVAEDEARRVAPFAVVEAGVPPGGIVPEGAAWTLAHEDGGMQEGRGDTLPVLPLGLHDLTVARRSARSSPRPRACRCRPGPGA